MGRVEFRLLGPLVVQVNGSTASVGSPKLRSLIAVLLLNVGDVVPVERLAAAIWGDAQPDHPRRAVQLYVTRLRALLADDPSTGLVVNRPGGYLLDIASERTDLGRFNRLISRADHALLRGDADREAAALAEALAQWHGEPLTDVPSELLHRESVPALRERRLRALERRIDVDLRRGRHAELVVELSALTAQHPLRERFWAQFMTALFDSGRRADALNAYRVARRHLADELGIDPSDDLRLLHARILASPQDRGDNGSTAMPRVPRQLPLDIAAFVGRAWPLDQLDAALTEHHRRGPGAVLVNAITGTAGVGKTTLAVHWARRVVDSFPDGQVWLNLRGYDPTTALSPQQALIRILRSLGVPPATIPADLEGQIEMYRSALDGRRMLVVLDNATNADHVRPLLPGAPGCLVIVTSRDQLIGLTSADGVRRLSLDVLSAAEAREMLAQRLGPRRISAEPEAVGEIIARCAGLPLALAVVAARAATHPRFRLAHLALELREAGGSLDAFERAGADVRAVFSWSYEKLSADSARLFRLLGLHPGPDIDASAAAGIAGLTLPSVEVLLTGLCRAQLITEHKPGRFHLHDLLRAYANELAHEPHDGSDRRGIRQRMLEHYLHAASHAALVFDPSRPPIPLAKPMAVVDLRDADEANAWLKAEYQVLLAVVNVAATNGFDSHTWRLASTLESFQDRREHWSDLAATQQAALEAALRAGDRRAEARARRMRAVAHLRRGAHHEASRQLLEALAVAASCADATEQALAHLHLAHASEARGELRLALEHVQRSLEFFELTDDVNGQARALNGVGWYRTLLGEHDLGLVNCERALKLFEEQGDEDGQALTWDSIGYCHLRLGDHPQAIACYEKALALFVDAEINYFRAHTLTRLAEALQLSGDLIGARRAWAEALTILTDIGHADAAAVRARIEEFGERR